MKEQMKKDIANTSLVSFVVTALLFLWLGGYGFNIADEGYLWYGVQRVMRGDTPILDFSAYDPGRYYLSAWLMLLAGDSGIMALRVTTALFMFPGILIGILLVMRSVKIENRWERFFWFAVLGVTLGFVYPARHKPFDFVAAIGLIGILAFLVNNPTLRRYFLAGLGVGAIALLGRNHGFYGAVGSIGVMLWLALRKTEKSPSFLNGFLLWCAGVLSGYSPIILMMLLIPGFAEAFWNSIRMMLETGQTNLPLPVPWPWRVDFSAPLVLVARSLLLGVLFIGVLVYGASALFWAIWARLKKTRYTLSPVLIATGFLALPYSHYAFSRADAGHLMHGFFPALIGILTLLLSARTGLRRSATLLVCIVGIWEYLPLQPGWHCWRNSECKTLMITGTPVSVPPWVAEEVTLYQDLIARHAPDGGNFYAAPYAPGAYAIFGRLSPVWDLCGLFRRPENFELEEIERLKAANPRFVVLTNWWRVENIALNQTHPLTYKYVTENFDMLPSSTGRFDIFIARNPENTKW
jgi:hypothetical protein